jgi:hypothetical protein
VTVESGATLDITGQRIANAIVNHGGTLIGVSTLSGDVSESQTFANVTVADNLTISSGTTTFAAPVSGDVTVQSGAAATFADVLNAAVSVQGDVTIAGPAGATAAIDIASGGSVTFADGASYAGASISNDGSVLIDTSSTFTFTTGIVGTGSVSMIGSGVLDLAGTNPYLGPTFVDQGTLLVNGDLTNSDVTIAVDGILGGSGSIGGDVVVEGTLSPGNSPGLLTVAGLTLLDSSTTFMQIEGSGRGTHYDAVDVTGAARLGGGLVLDLIASFGENATFELFHFNGGVDGHFSSLTARGGYGNLTFLRTAPTTWSFVTATGDLFRFDESSGNLGVVVHQTPEPSTWAMLATGAAVAGWHARRRGRRPAGVQ